MFTDRATLQRTGFQGFLTVDQLIASVVKPVPDHPGVYAVLHETGNPVFLPESVGGHFKGRNPTVPVSDLQKSWVPTSNILYIGRAGKLGEATGLRRRLREHLSLGCGKPVGHWGGRYIWQLRDSDRLVICWRETPGREPEDIETEMLLEFIKKHGRLPFANLTLGTRKQAVLPH